MASIEIKLKMDGLASVQKQLARLAGGELREAQARALNDTGHHLRRAMAKEFASAFDRPTPFITRSPKFIEATPDNLSLRILPTLDARNLPGKGGKVGVDPQHVLQAQEFGGQRADKKSEVVLRRARILPNGYQTAIPSDDRGGPFPGSDDGRGNIRAGFMVKLLSYLQAFGEVGFKANITDRSAMRRKDIADVSNIATRRTARLMDGWEFFVSKGKGSIKTGYTRPHMSGREKVYEHDRRQNLQAGIWARKGKELRPVLLFVKRPSYAPRISMQAIADGSGAEDYLAKRLRFRIRQIVEMGEASGVRL